MTTKALAARGSSSRAVGVVAKVKEERLQLHEYGEDGITITPARELRLSRLRVRPLPLLQHVKADVVAKHMRVANTAHEDNLRWLMGIRVREQQLEVEDNTFVVTTPNNVAMPLHHVVLQRQRRDCRQLP
jgi:hypothetical protein